MSNLIKITQMRLEYLTNRVSEALDIEMEKKAEKKIRKNIPTYQYKNLTLVKLKSIEGYNYLDSGDKRGLTDAFFETADELGISANKLVVSNYDSSQKYLFAAGDDVYVVSFTDIDGMDESAGEAFSIAFTRLGGLASDIEMKGVPIQVLSKVGQVISICLSISPNVYLSFAGTSEGRNIVYLNMVSKVMKGQKLYFYREMSEDKHIMGSKRDRTFEGEYFMSLNPTAPKSLSQENKYVRVNINRELARLKKKTNKLGFTRDVFMDAMEHASLELTDKIRIAVRPKMGWSINLLVHQSVKLAQGKWNASIMGLPFADAIKPVMREMELDINTTFIDIFNSGKFKKFILTMISSGTRIKKHIDELDWDDLFRALDIDGDDRIGDIDPGKLEDLIYHISSDVELRMSGVELRNEIIRTLHEWDPHYDATMDMDRIAFLHPYDEFLHTLRLYGKMFDDELTEALDINLDQEVKKERKRGVNIDRYPILSIVNGRELLDNSIGDSMKEGGFAKAAEELGIPEDRLVIFAKDGDRETHRFLETTSMGNIFLFDVSGKIAEAYIDEGSSDAYDIGFAYYDEGYYELSSRKAAFEMLKKVGNIVVAFTKMFSPNLLFKFSGTSQSRDLAYMRMLQKAMKQSKIYFYRAMGYNVNRETGKERYNKIKGSLFFSFVKNPPTKEKWANEKFVRIDPEREIARLRGDIKQGKEATKRKRELIAMLEKNFYDDTISPKELARDNNFPKFLNLLFRQKVAEPGVGDWSHTVIVAGDKFDIDQYDAIKSIPTKDDPDKLIKFARECLKIGPDIYKYEEEDEKWNVDDNEDDEWN